MKEMEISREQKDKILKYLCKKANVTLLVDDERYLEAQHANGFCVYVKSCRPEGVHSIYFKMIEINDQDKILDVLLNEVREDYSICFYDQWNRELETFIPKSTTLENLLIEMDLNA